MLFIFCKNPNRTSRGMSVALARSSWEDLGGKCDFTFGRQMKGSPCFVTTSVFALHCMVVLDGLFRS